MKKSVPNLESIVARTAATMGGSDFGVPDLPQQHMPRQANADLLWKFWNIARNTMVLNEQPPEYWPFITGMAAQQLILTSKDSIDPTLAARIVMEAAIPMSRLSPDKVHAAHL